MIRCRANKRQKKQPNYNSINKYNVFTCNSNDQAITAVGGEKHAHLRPQPHPHTKYHQSRAYRIHGSREWLRTADSGRRTAHAAQTLVLLMHASKAILNLPTSRLHLCSPLQQNRKVKIHHQFISFPKQLGQDSLPRK